MGARLEYRPVPYCSRCGVELNRPLAVLPDRACRCGPYVMPRTRVAYAGTVYKELRVDDRGFVGGEVDEEETRLMRMLWTR